MVRIILYTDISILLKQLKNIYIISSRMHFRYLMQFFARSVEMRKYINVASRFLLKIPFYDNKFHVMIKDCSVLRNLALSEKSFGHVVFPKSHEYIPHADEQSVRTFYALIPLPFW